MAIFGVRGAAEGRSASLLLLILACSSELYTSPCVAFFLPVVAKPAARSRVTSSALVARHCSSSGSSSSTSNRAGFSHVAGRSFSALAASGDGADAGPTGASADIFDALMAGDIDFVTEYVRSGGDCSVQDSIGDTPLMLAVESELTSAVRLLLNEGGARANLASETTGETPLMLAAYYGHTNLARILITEGGAELELRNKKGDTALGLACFWGNEDTVEYLLEAGCDPNSRNDAGERPGDKFDAVFVPDMVDNFFTADEESDRENAGSGGGGDVDLDLDDDDEEDIMFDELVGEGTGEPSSGDGEDKNEKNADDVPEGKEDGGDKAEPSEELQGPRAAILAMLEQARAKAASEAS